jgi:hypothetical protein
MELADELVIKDADLTVQDELGREQPRDGGCDPGEAGRVVNARAAHQADTGAVLVGHHPPASYFSS